MPERAHDLDLHKFYRDPDKARAVIDACIADCVQKNIGLVRVVHGKGKGNFRDLIHSHLGKHPDVEGYILCDPMHGGSGATWVHIRVEKPGVPAKTKSLPVLENEIDSGLKPMSPWVRRALLLILLAASFVVFPSWIARAGMVFLVLYMELRFSQPYSYD